MRKIMWNLIRKPLLALSVGLNLAFVAIWLGHSIPAWTTGQKITNTIVGQSSVPSVLHRKIGVTPEQWEQIEPIILDFREKALNQRQMITSLRAQLMEPSSSIICSRKRNYCLPIRQKNCCNRSASNADLMAAWSLQKVLGMC